MRENRFWDKIFFFFRFQTKEKQIKLKFKHFQLNLNVILNKYSFEIYDSYPNFFLPIITFNKLQKKKKRVIFCLKKNK